MLPPPFSRLLSLSAGFHAFLMRYFSAVSLSPDITLLMRRRHAISRCRAMLIAPLRFLRC